MEILNLAWLIPLFPLLAFVAIILFAYRNRELSHQLTIGGIGLAFLVAQVVFWRAVTRPVGGGERAFQSELVHWLMLGGEGLALGVYVDPLTAVMVCMAPPLCMLISIYSVGYMGFGTPRVDDRYGHFFAYLSLMTASMLGAVVSNNLLALFIFWEIMGACTYLLIGFRSGQGYPGLKAFIVFKAGDVLLMLGLALLYAEVGSLAYQDIFTTETLEHLALTTFWSTEWSMTTVIALLLFGGVVSGSAQFPLHTWLPDAMEAPDPASALIHAATTSSAGIFLMVRVFPILQTAEAGALAIGGIPFAGFIGAFTALCSSIIALTQDDIKDVLAFSTISQLGYMTAAIGVGAYVAGAFHLIIHAIFRTLLFLGTGSVIKGMKQGHHHAHEQARNDELTPNEKNQPILTAVKDDAKKDARCSAKNSMMKMGGLAKRMPRTFWTFLIGGLALAGFPLVTAGFWSNNAILTQVYGVYPSVFWTLATTTGLTALYTMRQVCLIFAGKPRTEAAEHTTENEPLMTIPLMILTILTISLGWIGIPDHFPVIGGHIPNWFQDFIRSTVGTGYEAQYATSVAGHLSATATQQPLIIGALFALAGSGLGWLVYGRKPLVTGDRDRIELAMRTIWLGWLYEAMENHFYLDALYQVAFIRPSIWLAERFAALDDGNREGKHGIVDGLVNALGRMGLKLTAACSWFEAQVTNRLVGWVSGAGASLSQAFHSFDLNIIDGSVKNLSIAIKAAGKTIRPIQTGKVQNYLLLTFLVILALIVTFFMILFLQI